MSLLDTLLGQGYVLPGAKPKTITSEGGAPQDNVDTSPLGNALRELQTSSIQNQLKDEQKKKDVKDQADMYNTLRQAGYTPAQAHDAVLSGNFPKDIAAGDNLKDQKTKAEINQLNSETTKNNATADLYGRKTGSNQGTKSKVEADIMGRILDGTATDADMQIYKDVIKKKDAGGLAELLGKLGDGSGDAPGAGTSVDSKVKVGDPKVPVTSPDGTPGYIPQSKLEAALKRGYKKR